jgi:hypothetical protein
MTAPTSHELTQLLQAWSDGDEGALDTLMPLAYQELHRSAERYMAGERPGHPLRIDDCRLRKAISHQQSAISKKGRIGPFFALADR